MEVSRDNRAQRLRRYYRLSSASSSEIRDGNRVRYILLTIVGHGSRAQHIHMAAESTKRKIVVDGGKNR